MNTFLLCLIALFASACSDSTPGTPGPVGIERLEDGFFIEDVTGKRWDVTHALSQYGMQPSRFQYGLGPQAIQPIANPHMLLSGEPGYPDTSDAFLVMGVNLNGFIRAYPIQVMGWHEVANEKFGEAHVAVAY